jgi:transposase-like protein
MVQSRRNKRAALRFFRKFFKRQGSLPWKVMTDKLRSYSSVITYCLAHFHGSMYSLSPKTFGQL